MVEVEVAYYNHFYVVYIVAGQGNLRIQVLGWVVVYAGEDILDWWTDIFGIVFPRAGLVEDEAFGWVLDEDAEHDQFTAFVGRVWV